MENKKINKLVVPLTLRTASILSAFTLMATSVGGCVQKNRDDNNNDEIISSTILPNDNDKDIKKDLDNKVDDNKNEEQKEVDNGITENNNNVNDNKNNSNSQNSNSTSEKNNTGSNNNINNKSDNNNTVGNNNTGDNNNNNGNNNSQDPSQKDDGALIPFSPLTAENIKDPRIFARATYELADQMAFKDSTGSSTAIYVYYYNDKKCASSPFAEEETKVVLAVANQKYLSGSDYVNIFEDKSLEDLKKEMYILQMLDVRTLNNNKINWQSLMVDKEMGNFIMNMQNKTYNQLVNGASDFEQSFNQYYYDKSGEFVYGQNAFLDVLITGYAKAIYKDNKDNNIYYDAYWSYKDSMEMLENELSDIYNKMPSHTKVLKK